MSNTENNKETNMTSEVSFAFTKAELMRQATRVSIRAEVIEMITNILNQVLSVTQASDKPVPNEIIEALQLGINNECAKTETLLSQLDAATDMSIEDKAADE